jgi:hypothetical protein
MRAAYAVAATPGMAYLRDPSHVAGGRFGVGFSLGYIVKQTIRLRRIRRHVKEG